eukprot:1867693-Amphidinium_carterae.1
MLHLRCRARRRGDTDAWARARAGERAEQRCPGEALEGVVLRGVSICPTQGRGLHQAFKSFSPDLERAYDTALVVLPHLNVEGRPLEAGHDQEE